MKPAFSVIYYSNGAAPDFILDRCAAVLHTHVLQADGELIAVTWKQLPISLPGVHNLVWPIRVDSHESIYRQILRGLEIVDTDIIFLAEHDVLYPNDYFAAMIAVLGQKIYYNYNAYFLNQHGYFRPPMGPLLSNLCARRELLKEQIGLKLQEHKQRGRVIWTEPYSRDLVSIVRTPTPTVDLRHGQNFTGMRTAADAGSYRQEIPYWGRADLWLRK